MDDDASIRESLTKVLEDDGYEVVTASDGMRVREVFDSEPIDLMLLDIGLPIKSGWETFEQITGENPLLPIIIITGQANQDQMAEAAGVGALMEKPLDAAQLLQTIRELLSEPAEARLARLCGYTRHLRHIPSSSAALIRRLRTQYDTPFRCTLPKGSLDLRRE